MKTLVAVLVAIIVISLCLAGFLFVNPDMKEPAVYCYAYARDINWQSGYGGTIRPGDAVLTTPLGASIFCNCHKTTYDGLNEQPVPEYLTCDPR